MTEVELFDVEYDAGLKRWFMHFRGEMIALASMNEDAAYDEAWLILEAWV